LCEQYGISSTTVRRTLQELVRDGLIHRRAGIGTFVSSPSRRSILLIVVGFDNPEWLKRSYFFSNLIAGIATVTWENDAIFSVVHLLASACADGGVESLISSIIDEMSFDGFLLRLEGNLQEEYLTPFFNSGFPYVVIKRYLPHRPINCVVVDDKQIAFEATGYLIGLGHVRVGLITTRSQMTGSDRYKGYLKSLETHGIAADPSLICWAKDYYEEYGYEAAVKLLALEDRPTAIFAASDLLAVGAYAAIKEAGLRIPEDVAVVGCADIPAAASLVPSLTTVKVFYYDLGVQSTKFLLDIISDKMQPPQKVTIEHSLIMRESCGSDSKA